MRRKIQTPRCGTLPPASWRASTGLEGLHHQEWERTMRDRRRSRFVRVAGFLIAVSIGLWSPDTGRAQNTQNTQNNDVVAKIGDRVITLKDLEERLRMLPDSVRQKLASGDNLKIFLHNQVTKELLALEAARQGLDKDPRVRARIEEVRRDVLTNALTNKLLGELTVTEDEMAAYYAKNKNEFGGKPYQEVRPDIAQRLRNTKSRQALQKVEREATARWPVTTNEALLEKL